MPASRRGSRSRKRRAASCRAVADAHVARAERRRGASRAERRQLRRREQLAEPAVVGGGPLHVWGDQQRRARQRPRAPQRVEGGEARRTRQRTRFASIAFAPPSSLPSATAASGCRRSAARRSSAAAPEPSQRPEYSRSSTTAPAARAAVGSAAGTWRACGRAARCRVKIVRQPTSAQKACSASQRASPRRRRQSRGGGRRRAQTTRTAPRVLDGVRERAAELQQEGRERARRRAQQRVVEIDVEQRRAAPRAAAVVALGRRPPVERRAHVLRGERGERARASAQFVGWGRVRSSANKASKSSGGGGGELWVPKGLRGATVLLPFLGRFADLCGDLCGDGGGGGGGGDGGRSWRRGKAAALPRRRRSNRQPVHRLVGVLQQPCARVHGVQEDLHRQTALPRSIRSNCFHDALDHLSRSLVRRAVHLDVPIRRARRAVERLRLKDQDVRRHPTIRHIHHPRNSPSECTLRVAVHRRQDLLPADRARHHDVRGGQPVVLEVRLPAAVRDATNTNPTKKREGTADQIMNETACCDATESCVPFGDTWKMCRTSDIATCSVTGEQCWGKNDSYTPMSTERPCCDPNAKCVHTDEYWGRCSVSDGADLVAPPRPTPAPTREIPRREGRASPKGCSARPTSTSRSRTTASTTTSSATAAARRAASARNRRTSGTCRATSRWPTAARAGASTR